MPISDDPAIMLAIAAALWTGLLVHWAFTIRRR